jgi:SAM-dependent methyltransferase
MSETKAALPPRLPEGGPLERAPTLEDVRACYRLILGREPEDDGVLQRHLDRNESLAALRGHFFRSEEFRFGRMGPVVASVPPEARAPEMDVAADLPEAMACFERVRRVWVKLGETSPHWSSLNDERFRPARIEENRRAFHASGAEDLALLAGALSRAGLPRDGSRRRLVEFGCGVGRATLQLMALARDVTGVDISAPHLALAKQEAEARRFFHLRWVRARPEAPMPPQDYDVWFSRRTLQHNPPPLIRWILQRAFAGLRPGGLAMFQVPTFATGYRFSLAEYLTAKPPTQPEMHMMPQAEVLALAEEAGCRLVELREDTGLLGLDGRAWISNLFVFRKPG